MIFIAHHQTMASPRQTQRMPRTSMASANPSLFSDELAPVAISQHMMRGRQENFQTFNSARVTTHGIPK